MGCLREWESTAGEGGDNWGGCGGWEVVEVVMVDVAGVDFCRLERFGLALIFVEETTGPSGNDRF